MVEDWKIDSFCGRNPKGVKRYASEWRVEFKNLTNACSTGVGAFMIAHKIDRNKKYSIEEFLDIVSSVKFENDLIRTLKERYGINQNEFK